MIFDYLSIIMGIFKIMVYKMIYFNRIKFESIIKINHNFKISTRKKTKIIIGKNFKARNNINIRNDLNGKLIIGDNVFFNDNVSINCQQSINIGNNVSIGHNVLILDHDHDYKNNMENFVMESVSIGNNVWIGANVIILKGSVIPDNTVIAAGTIVNKRITKELTKNKLVYDRRNNVIKEV